VSGAPSDRTETVEPPTHLSEPPTPPARTGTSGTTVGSPLEALERDEILRTRKFCGIAFTIALFGAGSVAVLPGDPTVTVILLSAIGIAIMAVVFLLHRTSDPVQFRRPTTLLGWFIPALAVTAAIPFFGVFSPVGVILVLGIYFTGLGRSTPLAYAVYAMCAGAQALVALLVITGATRDTGIVHFVHLGVFEEVVIQGLVQMILFATLLTARVSRRTALLAVGELERAVRFAAHREALLLEAREELERALRSGRGRFTDQTLGGYKLGAVLGRGAMGEVYEAVDARNQAVAIKLLSQTSLGNLNHVLRFLRELRMTVGLDSPNIVRVIEVGEQPVPYLVMEKLEGKTLSDILRSKYVMPVAEIVDMIRQVGAGITAAAGAGIVHRDLKPQNVFRHGRTWKILDFGVSRAVDSSDTLTAGHIVGTPSYMAPEQASGATVDHATDLYALAAIAYRAFTGRPPFAAGEIAETLYRVVHTAPQRPSALVDDLPLQVDLVLAIGLAKQPRDRFRSAAELSDALALAVEGRLALEMREHGVGLVQNGAWSTSKRSSTARIRAPRS
jgi:tRNA A-37 threonylcarbamoyl transferase component Bud32